MAKLNIVVFVLSLFVLNSEQAEIEIRRFYRIENADSTV